MPREFQVRYGRLPDGAMPLQQFIGGVWVTVPAESVASLANDTVSTPTPTSNAKLSLPPPLPARPADAKDLDTLVAVLMGGRPRECHVTHIDQCTANVDLRDLMRVAGPEWQAKLREIEEIHAVNQAARVAREAKGEEGTGVFAKTATAVL